MGELERLKEFNVKLTKQEFDKIGYAGVLKELAGQFEGGAEKLSKTAAGILATLQGYRGSLMRSIGEGFLIPMKPRLDKINKWLENNQETWGGWKKTVSEAGEAFSEFAFSKGERLFNYLSDVFNSAENKDLTVGAKINIVASDTKGYIKKHWDESIKPAISEWWNSTGQPFMVDTGVLIGEAIVKGMGIAVKEGIGILGTLWGDVEENRKDHGAFSKETGGSFIKAAGASMLAGWGAFKILKPFINGGKNVFTTGKSLWDKFGGTKTKDTPKTKETTSTKPTGGSYSEQSKQKSQNKNPSNESKTKPTSYKKDKTTSKSFMDTIKDFKMPKGVSKWTKRIPVLGAAFSIFDGLSGGSSWSSIAGSAAGGWAGAGAGAALGSFLGPAGTLIGGVGGGIGGAIGGEKFANWLTSKISGLFSSKTASAAEATPKPYMSKYPTLTNFTPPTNTQNTQSTQSNQSTGSNALIEQKTQAVAKQLEDIGNAVYQSGYNFITAFAQLNPSVNSMKTNFDNLVKSSGEAAISLSTTFAPMQIRGMMLGTSMDAMTMTLMQSTAYVSGAYTPLAPKGILLNAGMSVLILSTLQASASLSSFGGIAEKVNALKSAIDGLRSRINNVSVPSVPSAVPTGPKTSLGPARKSSGGYVPYANGGLIDRPHMGLVGEAGPEAIIPLSPSRRGRGRELLSRAASALGVQPYADGGLVGGNVIEGYGDIATANGGASISVGDIIPQVQITVQANENGQVDLSNLSDEVLDAIGVKLAGKVTEAFSNMMVTR